MPAARTTASARVDVGARCGPCRAPPSTRSDSDSTALTTNSAAQRRQLGHSVRGARDVLDLRGDVEGHRRVLGVQRARDAQRVAGPVEEVRVAEGDVARAGRDLPARRRPARRRRGRRRSGRRRPAESGSDGTCAGSRACLGVAGDAPLAVAIAGARSARAPAAPSRARRPERRSRAASVTPAPAAPPVERDQRDQLLPRTRRRARVSAPVREQARG